MFEGDLKKIVLIDRGKFKMAINRVVNINEKVRLQWVDYFFVCFCWEKRNTFETGYYLLDMCHSASTS